jgi:hypothetical protein
MASDSIPEEWRPVEGWPYEVSNHGRVRRAMAGAPKKGAVAGRLRAPWKDRYGYLCVTLKDRPRHQTRRIHRLVAAAFLDPAPSPAHVVAHGDGDQMNNTPSNLRWATVMENVRDTVRHGRSTRGERHGRSKLTAAQVLEIRHIVASKALTQVEVAARFGVSNQLIANIVHWHCWKWLPR